MDNIIIREIQEADLEKGFLESLDNLKKASDLEINNARTMYVPFTWSYSRSAITLPKSTGTYNIPAKVVEIFNNAFFFS